MRRVLVIGISGAGKSTFSRVLAARTKLPLIHLDREFWQPGWKVTPRNIWRARVEQLAAGDTWIMDGNYDSSLDLRLPRADTVVWFAYPTHVCLQRALRRVVTNYGRVRADLGEGCPERFDWEFLRYIWGFNAKEQPRITSALGTFGRHLEPVMVRSNREAGQVLARLAPAGDGQE